MRCHSGHARPEGEDTAVLVLVWVEDTSIFIAKENVRIRRLVRIWVGYDKNNGRKDILHDKVEETLVG